MNISDLEFYTYKAKCKRIVDGDTMVVIADLGFGVSKEMMLRLLDIDTPELRSKNVSERTHAQKAKEFVERQIFWNDPVTRGKCNLVEQVSCNLVIKTKKDKTGKYGRYLATVYYQCPLSGVLTDLNQMLKDEGFEKKESYDAPIEH